MEISIQDICQFATQKTKEAKSEEYREKYGQSTIVLFRVGDFWEAYGECAADLARATGVTLSIQNGMKLAAFPKRSEDVYFPKLVREGFKVALVDENI